MVCCASYVYILSSLLLNAFENWGLSFVKFGKVCSYLKPTRHERRESIFDSKLYWCPNTLNSLKIVNTFIKY